MCIPEESGSVFEKKKNTSNKRLSQYFWTRKSLLSLFQITFGVASQDLDRKIFSLRNFVMDAVVTERSLGLSALN
jgi:hypothetical protein